MLNINDYIEMLTYKRPQGSESQKDFCERYLEPLFGKPDAVGNYILTVGDNPDIAFMSHHDTVHHMGGRQIVETHYPFVKATADCLGADCTSGIYIMLNMIHAGVKGVYIVHAAEEVGCIGSRHIVQNTPHVVENCEIAISFDRFGYDSIITHQMGSRTCSEAFSRSLSAILNENLQSDNTGSYTDSNEYRGIISECTNVSVGYFKQHTSKEYQDLRFLDELVQRCIDADWNQLVISRQPTMVDEYKWDVFDDADKDGMTMYDVVYDRPEEVAKLLESFGYNVSGLLDDLDTMNQKQYFI